MRRSILFLIAFFALVVSSLSAQTSQADSIVQSLVDSFTQIHWDMPYDSLPLVYPGAVCDTFHGNSYVRSSDEEWCFNCIQRFAGFSVHSFFYSFEANARPECKLQQIRYAISSGPENQVLAMYHSLVKNISEILHARAIEVQWNSTTGPFEFGSADWRDWVQIQNGRILVYIYHTTSSDSSALWLIARDRPLVSEKSRTDRLRDYGVTFDWEIGRKLAVHFDRKDSAVANLLRQEEIGGDSSSQEELHTILLVLLDSVQTTDDSVRPMFLLAADLLARQFRTVGKRWDEDRTRLQKEGITFAYGEFAFYHRDLLWKLWETAANTKWGQAAFLLLLSRGFDTSDQCKSGADRFTNAIKGGEKFLAVYPTSVWNPQVMYFLAQAYETWWSITQARMDDYVEQDDLDKYTPGAERARQEAVFYYEAALKGDLPKNLRDHAEHRLPRLKLRIDTNQRAFWCIYD